MLSTTIFITSLCCVFEQKPPLFFFVHHLCYVFEQEYCKLASRREGGDPVLDVTVRLCRVSAPLAIACLWRNT